MIYKWNFNFMFGVWFFVCLHIISSFSF
jgi:hypothetical protein